MEKFEAILWYALIIACAFLFADMGILAIQNKSNPDNVIYGIGLLLFAGAFIFLVVFLIIENIKEKKNERAVNNN